MRRLLGSHLYRYPVLAKTARITAVRIHSRFNVSHLRHSNRHVVRFGSTFSHQGIPHNSSICMDFFGEPISFLKHESSSITPTETVLAFDAHLIQIVSKGRAYNNGGDEFGIRIKAAHSSAITWADLIRHCLRWTERDAGGVLKTHSPMLIVAAFSPLLTNSGVSYLKKIDTEDFDLEFSFVEVIGAAVVMRHFDALLARERNHLQALQYLMNNEPDKALATLCKLLEKCPGDALALSLIMDLSYYLTDNAAAFNAATTVASYWNERGQRGASGQTAIQGHALGSSLISLGLALGGRVREAEQLAEMAISRDKTGSAGVAAWALSHIYDVEGRSSEGASTFTGHGVQYFEPCGFLFFDTRMNAAGATSIIDRSGATADRVALRIYDESFGKIFEYSGYDGTSSTHIRRRVPGSQQRKIIESAATSASSMFKTLFGQNADVELNDIVKSTNHEVADAFPDSIMGGNEILCLEDVLTWLPPTSIVLSEATFVLFRLTSSGAIQPNDQRWKKLREAWGKHSDAEDYSDVLITKIAKALSGSNISKDIEVKMQSQASTGARLVSAAHMLGLLLSDSTGSRNIDDWAKVAELLREVRTGWTVSDDELTKLKPDIHYSNLPNIPLRNFIEHAICYAAIMSDDEESICFARSICSESVTLKSNSPEPWHRYGIILKKLGDEENAEDAFHASVSLGSGEGGRVG
jgi:tetratricopeptide (TPR) repeat protein